MSLNERCTQPSDKLSSSLFFLPIPNVEYIAILFCTFVAKTKSYKIAMIIKLCHQYPTEQMFSYSTLTSPHIFLCMHKDDQFAAFMCVSGDSNFHRNLHLFLFVFLIFFKLYT